MCKPNKKNLNVTAQTNAISDDPLAAEDSFIMLPTVDFCFKELMHNETVRQGIIASILNIPLNEVTKRSLCQQFSEKNPQTTKFSGWKEQRGFETYGREKF